MENMPSHPQNKFFATLGKIKPHMKEEAIDRLQERKVTLLIPSMYRHSIDMSVVEHMTDSLAGFQKETGSIDTILLGQDAAPTKYKFNKVKKIWKDVPNLKVMWNSSPELQKWEETVKNDLKINIQQGKGLNMWKALIYRYEKLRGSIFALHDADIVKERYSAQDILLSLLAPIVHPQLKGDFVKAFYTRLEQKDMDDFILRGRVARLLARPMVESMKKHYADSKIVRDQLEFFNTFIYPLSGEFAMAPNIARDIRIQRDYGLETAVINNMFGKNNKIYQVDLGIYDHEHQELSHDNPNKGLNRMAEEVTKAMLRKIYSLIGSEALDDKKFKDVVIDYVRYARRHTEHYESYSIWEGMSYSMANELNRVQVFEDAIIRAYNDFKKSPDEMVPLIQVDELPEETRKDLVTGFEKYF